MADWPRQGGAQRYSIGVMEGTYGTPVVCATAFVKGAWKELFAALPFDAQGLLINVTHNAAGSHYLLDIGVGAASSEVVLIPNAQFSYPRAFQAGIGFYIPISIPKGTRVAARIAASAITDLYVQFHAVAGGPDTPGLGHAEAYGIDVGNSRGTDIDPGGTPNTKSAWVQMTAATGVRIRQLLFFYNGRTNTAMVSANYVFDIGIGAAASETVILPDFVVQANLTSDDTGQQVVGPLPVDIPAGTRIAVRMSSETADATDRLLQVSLIGVG